MLHDRASVAWSAGSSGADGHADGYGVDIFGSQVVGVDGFVAELGAHGWPTRSGSVARRRGPRHAAAMHFNSTA